MERQEVASWKHAARSDWSCVLGSSAATVWCDAELFSTASTACRWAYISHYLGNTFVEAEGRAQNKRHESAFRQYAVGSQAAPITKEKKKKRLRFPVIFREPPEAAAQKCHHHAKNGSV